MTKETLYFSIMIAALLAGLVWLSIAGYIIAVVILSVLTTILVFVAGGLLTMKTVSVMNSKQQQDFVENAKENLAIMGRMQSVQNQQNSQLLRQVKALPSGNGDNGYQPVFDIDDTLFLEVDN